MKQQKTRTGINWRHLLYVIPLCLLIGFAFGFYYNIPKIITIDFGDNVVYALNKTDELRKSIDCYNDTLLRNDMANLKSTVSTYALMNIETYQNRCNCGLSNEILIFCKKQDSFREECKRLGIN